MRKSYEALSVDVVKFEAQDVITASGTLTDKTANDPTEKPINPDGGIGER